MAITLIKKRKSLYQLYTNIVTIERRTGPREEKHYTIKLGKTIYKTLQLNQF